MEASPWDRWSAVPASAREELRRCMAAGKRHPDDEVAEAAIGWADVLIGAHEASQPGWLGRLVFVVGKAFDVFFGLIDLTGSAGADRADRRWAHRVLETQVRRQT